MTQRLTSYLLVILKHEKPVKDLPDVIAARLSMMEGVDGSGVIVSQVTQFEANTMIERAEAEDEVRFNGKPVELSSGREDVLNALRDARNDVYGYSRPLTLNKIVRGLSEAEKEALINITAEDLLQGRPVKAGGLVLQNITASNPSGMSDEEIDKTARMLTKGMGENITP